MTSVSDDGERTCPLCAEEMDLTDQQLKPCKCGYEICVWCWHHIIDMAEKEETEGRCPACRMPYDKERIVGMAANCEWVVAEMNAEKKQKAQKTKPKASVEAKKHLNSVRVIQRNLVYIIGLPSNLCDESILERREYFGQYGKVLKVSISRPASAQQASNNNTFSVYITYAREEEAIRCIQAVHNYVLEGKSLRACFGTTKYCHAWLKNMTCNNPDCLYLHDIGTQEDSFTKDEIISAYTRSRVPQISSYNSQRRTGNVLPPPVDEFCITGTASGKNQIKIASNSTSSQVKGSSPNGSAGKSTVLPAAASWGIRALNSRPPAACSHANPVKQKVEINNNSSLPSLLIESTKQSAWNDEVVTASKVSESRTSFVNNSRLPTSLIESSKQSSTWHDEVVTKLQLTESREALPITGLNRAIEPSKVGSWKDSRLALSSQAVAVAETDITSVSSAWNDDICTRPKLGEEKYAGSLDDRLRQLDSQRHAIEKKSRTTVSDVATMDMSDITCASDVSSGCSQGLPASASDDIKTCIPVNGNKTNPTSNSMPKGHERQSTKAGADRVTQVSTTLNDAAQSLCLGISSINIESHDRTDQLNMYQHQALDFIDCSNKMPSSQDSASAPLALQKVSSVFDPHGKNELTDSSSELLNQGLISVVNKNDNPSMPYDNKIGRISDSADRLMSSHSSSSSWNNVVGSKQPSLVGVNIDRKLEVTSFPLRHKESALTNGPMDDGLSSSSDPRKVFVCPVMNCTEEKIKSFGRGDGVSNCNRSSIVNTTGESSIISDILSLDFDPWDDSLFSANKFSSLLGETEKQEGAFKLSSSWKPQNSNQSRFSFARQENQGSFLKPPILDKNESDKFYSSQYSYEGLQNGLMFNTSESPNAVITSNPVSLSDRSVGISRSKISAPPGFSAPSRAPPPGFSSQDRYNQPDETAYLESSLHGTSFGSHYQPHVSGNLVDIEFIDPAILAVGKGRMPLGVNNSGLGVKSTFSTNFSTSDSDPRLHQFMQQSVSSSQNLRIPDHIGDRFLPVNDTFSSQFLAQNHINLSPFEQMLIQQPRNPHFPISQWDGWNDLCTGSDVGISDILNERYVLNSYYPSNEEHKFHMPSGDIYNRSFGM